MSFWTLLPAAASLAGTLLNRPKKKDYIYDTDYMDKYINNLRGQRLDSQISHMVMQPALRAIGQQGARLNRQTDYSIARRQPGGGVEAQMRLSGSQQSLRAIGIAGEKAFFEQYKEDRRIGDLITRIELEKGRYDSYGKRQLSRARTQWGADVASTGIYLAGTVGASIAATGQATVATRQADVGVLDKAKSLDLIDDATTLKEFSQIAANRGFENMSMFVNQLARDQGMEQALDVYDPRNIQSIEEIKEDARSGKITAGEAQSRLKKKIELEQEIRDLKYFDPADEEGLTRDDIISAREKGYISSKKAREEIDILEAVAERDKYIGIYTKGIVALKEHRETFPEDMAGSFDIIEKMDLPGEMKLGLIGKEVAFNKKQLTSYQKSVLGVYVDPKSEPDDFLPLMFKKGGDFNEAKWVAGLYMDRVGMKAQGAGKAGEKYEKIAEGKITAQLTRRNMLLTQSKLANDPALKYITDLLDIRSEADLVTLGRNLAGVQDRLAKLAEKADIPGTLQGYSALYGSSFTEEDIKSVENYNSVQRVKYLKQKWQDDIMDEIYKALKVVGFPGVMDPETSLGITSVGVLPQMVGTSKNEIPDDFDLSIWE